MPKKNYENFPIYLIIFYKKKKKKLKIILVINFIIKFIIITINLFEFYFLKYKPQFLITIYFRIIKLIYYLLLLISIFSQKKKKINK